MLSGRVTSNLLLNNALTQLGVKRITAAGDGQRGDHGQAQHHLVISNFNSLKMDATLLLQAVRTNPAMQEMAFIVLTRCRMATVRRRRVAPNTCLNRWGGALHDRHQNLMPARPHGGVDRPNHLGLKPRAAAKAGSRPIRLPYKRT